VRVSVEYVNARRSHALSLRREASAAVPRSEAKTYTCCNLHRAESHLRHFGFNTKARWSKSE
jgi:hypothetical protein